MRVRLFTIIVAGLCCLALSQEAKANRVVANTDVYYDASQNRMVGYTEATSSYFAGMYYCISVTVYLTTEGQWAGNSAWDGCVDGYAYTQATLPYDPNAEYNVDGEHTAEPYYRDDLGALIDYYNFQTYLEGIPVYYPSSYEFLGPGPRRPSIGAILLGTTFALFSQGTRHGQPHHLKVVSDSTTTESCGSKRRKIKLKVVDSAGRYAGRVSVVETFEDPNNPSITYSSIYNSCQNDNYSPYRCAGMDLDGTFTDQLWVGCPSSGGNCGFPDVGSRWWWCPRGRSRVSLTTNLYQVRHGYALVNGNSAFSPGTELY